VAKKKYEFICYAESRDAQGVLKTHNAGDQIMLDADEAKRFAGVIKPVGKATKPSDAEGAGEGEGAGDSGDDE